MLNKVVRVSVNNNFNCTVPEFKQLNDLKNGHPDKFFFVNSNIKTPKLLDINKHNYQAVITLNPDITIDKNLIQKFYDISCDKVAFARIKYIPGHKEIIDLINQISTTHTVVITLQRFNEKKTISQYVPLYNEHYTFSNTRYRLHGSSLNYVQEQADHMNRTYICDRSGLGCQGCGLCSILTIGKSLPIYTLNLSSSGICPYSCIDCYAKAIQHFLRKICRPVIRFDYIHRNNKQSGKTQHIKDVKEALS